MSAVSVNVDARQTTAEFDAMLAIIDNPSKVLRQSGQALLGLVRDCFVTETDPWGVPWAPHSPVTLAGRQRRGNTSTQKLIDSGVMYGSLTTYVSGVELVLEVDTVYAPVQQFGNDANRMYGGPEAPIPARPFLPVRSEGAEPEMPADWWPPILQPFDDAFLKAITE